MLVKAFTRSRAPPYASGRRQRNRPPHTPRKAPKGIPRPLEWRQKASSGGKRGEPPLHPASADRSGKLPLSGGKWRLHGGINPPLATTGGTTGHDTPRQARRAPAPAAPRPITLMPSYAEVHMLVTDHPAQTTVGRPGTQALSHAGAPSQPSGIKKTGAKPAVQAGLTARCRATTPPVRLRHSTLLHPASWNMTAKAC